MQLEYGVFVGLFLTGQKLAESELVGLARFAGKREYTRRDSNPQPSVPKTDALSS